MDSSVDDGGDFNKARGFLLTFSGVLMALWFFGANLTTFKLMGTEIHLEHRTNSVWLVLGCLNTYFWFRFLQHVPTGGFRFDEGMNHLYDQALIKAAICRKHFELKKSVKHIRTQKHAQGEKTKFYRGYAYLTCYERLKTDQREQPESEIELHDYSRDKRTEMNVSANYKFTKAGEWVQFGNNVRLDPYVPSRLFTWTVKTYVLLKGAFVTPWFTDRIAPLLVGLVSTSVALHNWWEVNHSGVIS